MILIELKIISRIVEIFRMFRLFFVLMLYCFIVFMFLSIAKKREKIKGKCL